MKALLLAVTAGFCIVLLVWPAADHARISKSGCADNGRQPQAAAWEGRPAGKRPEEEKRSLQTARLGERLEQLIAGLDKVEGCTVGIDMQQKTVRVCVRLYEGQTLTQDEAAAVQAQAANAVAGVEADGVSVFIEE